MSQLHKEVTARAAAATAALTSPATLDSPSSNADTALVDASSPNRPTAPRGCTCASKCNAVYADYERPKVIDFTNAPPISKAEEESGSSKPDEPSQSSSSSSPAPCLNLPEYTDDAPWVYEACKDPTRCSSHCSRAHADSIVIALHGEKCLDGKLRYSLYFGRDNPYNSVFELNDLKPGVSNTVLASLDAAIKALYLFKEVRIHAPGFHPFHSPHYTKIAVNALSMAVDPLRISSRLPYSNTPGALDIAEDKNKQAAKACCKCACDPEWCIWCRPKRLIVKTDSAVLVEIITDRLTKWVRSGFTPMPKLSNAFQVVYDLLGQILYEFWHNKCALEFWLVDAEEHNSMAVGMTRAASMVDKVRGSVAEEVKDAKT